MRATGAVEHWAERTTKPNVAVDTRADRAFCLAAVRLTGELPDTDGATEAAVAAARALIDLAVANDEAALRRLMRPDPGLADVTWTVACYQIGDLTPCTIEDYGDPVAAVTTLAACPEGSHVAAELLASTPAGTRWTVMTRTGQLLVFQLPDARTASDATREHPGELSLAIEHWQQQLVHWAATGGEEAAPGRAAPADVATPTGSLPEGEADLGMALEMVIEALRSVERRAASARHRNDDVMLRLDALDRRLTEFQAGIEGRIHALAGYVSELARALAAQQGAAAAHMDARFDELAVALPANTASTALGTGGAEVTAYPPGPSV